jgi:hypothetical protein
VGRDKEVEFGCTRRWTFNTQSQAAVEEPALEESEPADTKENSSRGCPGLEALDWVISEVSSNSRSLGLQDFRTQPKIHICHQCTPVPEIPSFFKILKDSAEILL